MSESTEPGGTDVAVPPQPHTQANGHVTEAPPTPVTRRRGRWPSLTVPGLWGAVVFACLSFTPSLLPRSGIIQGIVWGSPPPSATASGCCRRRLARVRRPGRAAGEAPPGAIFLIAGGVLVAVFFALGQYWQHQIRGLMGVTEYNVALVVLSPVVAAVLFVLLLLSDAGLRRLTAGLARLLDRWIGPRAAPPSAGSPSSASPPVISGVLLDGLVNAANETFGLRDTITTGGRPAARHRPEVRRQRVAGRRGTPSAGRAGRSPARARRAVRDRRRSTAPRRSPSAPTRAWPPPRTPSSAPSSPSTTWNTRAASSAPTCSSHDHRQRLGRPRVVGHLRVPQRRRLGDRRMQYSYLPSWMSYLVDQSKAREAGRALFDAVYERWSRLPAGQPAPALRGRREPGVVRRRDRLQRRGRPAQPHLRHGLRRAAELQHAVPEFSDHRDAGSPEIAAGLQGRPHRALRRTTPTAGIPPEGQPWEGSRGPLPDAPLRPHRLVEPRGCSSPSRTGPANRPARTCSHGVIWMPLVTFWQVTADLPFAGGVPAGPRAQVHGGEYADAWYAVLRPAGVTPDQLNELRAMAANAP